MFSPVCARRQMLGAALVIILATLVGCRGDVDGGDLDAIMEYFEFTSTTSPTVSAAERESCLTVDGLPGECVMYYLCNSNGTANTDGSNVIDIRARDGPCTSYLDSCCLPPDIQIAPNVTPTPSSQRPGCGWRNPNGVGLLTIGDVDGEAKFAEFPWMVAILRSKPLFNSGGLPSGQLMQVYVGGGSLIHPSVVLTAAHVAGGGNLVARAGEWDTQTTKEPYPHQDRDVARVVAHKQYNKNNLFHDVALLFLKLPMVLAPNVGLACLPPAGLNPLPGTRCLASGWGKDLFGQAGSYQVILKKLELPVVDKRTCEGRLRGTRLGRYFQLHPTFMCAGGEKGKDTCNGDGGSPLVCPIPDQSDRYMQSGMVAWGIGCGEELTPGVYVDVASLRSWIDSTVAAAGLDTSVYTF
ncbi:unnamed protein product, partial [Iphiclides podalirius]